MALHMLRKKQTLKVGIQYHISFMYFQLQYKQKNLFYHMLYKHHVSCIIGTEHHLR